MPVHDHATLTQHCLSRLLHYPAQSVEQEVVVVDDASIDHTAHLLAAYGQGIRVITHTARQGLVAACNAGAAAASGEIVVFVTNASLPVPGWLDALVEYLAQFSEVAIVGSRLLRADGAVHHAGIVIGQDHLPWPLYRGFPMEHPAITRSRPVPGVALPGMAVRRAAYAALGGLDGVLPAEWAAVDLCLRAAQRGDGVHYCHRSVLHFLGDAAAAPPRQASDPAAQVFLARWQTQVRPNDLDYYVEDGLLCPDYESAYPLRLWVDPQLAVSEVDARHVPIETMLAARARQMDLLLRENDRLRVRVRELAERLSAATDAALKPARLPASLARDGHSGATTNGGAVQPEIISRGTTHPLTSRPAARLISIVIPVKNGAGQLREVLPRVLAQQAEGSLELVAVDSGSTDESVAVLQEFGATVLRIPPQAFNHGLTRNLAAQHARGDILVFMNQDVLPADPRWLAPLVAPLLADRLVAGVCSRVLPHATADRLTYRDGMSDASASPERSVRWIQDWDDYHSLDPDQLRLFINCHSLSLAVPAWLFAQLPFRAMTTLGEDILWAKEALEAGFKIQHEPASVVYHSHAYSHAEIVQRNFDDGMATQAIVGRELAAAQVVPLIYGFVRDDWRYLATSADLSVVELEDLQIDAVLRRAAACVGQWLGINYEQLPRDVLTLLSLTHRIKGEVGAAPPLGEA